MKPEEFDHHIHEKLDGLHPVFEEKDWIRLSNKMKKRNYLLPLFNKTKWIVLALLVIFAGSWLALQWSDSSKETIIPLNQNRSTQTPLAGMNSSENSNRASEISVNTQDLPTSIAEPSNNTENTIASPLKNSISQESLSQQNKESDIKSASSVASNKLILSSPLENGQKELKESNTISSKILNEDVSKLDPSTGRSLQELKIVKPLQLIEDMEVNLKNKSIVKTRLKLLEGLKTHKWTLGIVALATQTHLNGGIAFEIKTNKNISFGSGLILQNYFAQNFVDQSDFKESTAGEFVELIKPRHGKSISFSDIHIKSYDVLLPLNLKYYFPLSLRYALFAGASMHLTLKSKTSLDFTYRSYDTPGVLDESDFYQPSNDATLINHFSFGTGIQRDFGKLICQASFLFLKNNNNQPQIEKLEPAAQIGVFYKL